MQPKSNVVLVHGEWSDGSSWSKVIPLLQNNGLRVTAVQIPLTSLADDVAVTRHVIGLQEGSTVLAGHSTEARSSPKPEPMRPTSSVWCTFRRLPPTRAKASAISMLAQPRRVWRTSVRMTRASCGSIPRHLARHSPRISIPSRPGLWPSCRNRSRQGFFGDKVTRPAWELKPSWYLVSEIDPMIPAETQRFMSKRIRATVLSVPASHWSMVFHPDKVAKLISDAASSAA
jgi:pimeloyl-ACP methyl ester carboxylesterase